MPPFFLLGLLSGTIADRWGPRALLRVGTQGAATLALLLLGGPDSVWAVIEVAGAGWQFAAVEVCYLLSAAAALAIQDPGRSLQPAAASVLRNLTGYVRLLDSHRLLLALMFLTAATEILGFTHMTLLPVFAKESLHIGPAGLGVTTAARQGGGLLGCGFWPGGAVKRNGLMMDRNDMGWTATAGARADSSLRSE